MNSPTNQTGNATLPLVSIVTPTYNQGPYLAETIRSVLAQDYPNIEYLVLDDGSTDNTPEVLKTFANGEFQWERQENMGQSRTLNKGWQRCKGRYLCYLSSDDRILPNCISTLVAAMEAHPEVSVAYCDTAVIDKHGKLVNKPIAPEFDRRQLIEELNCIPGVGAIFRREVFEKTGGWRPDLHQIPDFEFWLRAVQFGPFLRVPGSLSEYRVYEESGSIRPVSPQRSMEMVNTMRAYWKDDSNNASARRSVSHAHTLAAKLHAQSGRPLAAITQFFRAGQLRPRLFIQRSAWRRLISAFLIYRASQAGRITGHRR